MSEQNQEPERGQQGRQISINLSSLSRNTIVLLVTFLALALMIVLVFFIPVGSRPGDEANPNAAVTVTGQQSATPALTAEAVATVTPADGSAYPAPPATSLPEPADEAAPTDEA
ncbi:MAG: hypothetical protein H7Y32_19840, partial [Chloroflexales bacterium]|nr:hypothetical protein [Chloroflexales bacterium]